MTTAIITMAGFGRRFQDAGYSVPKYQVEAHGRSLFAWSMLSLSSFVCRGVSFVFVVRAADDARGFITAESETLGLEVASIVELDRPTDGQATSAMVAAPLVDNAAPMFIYNIDTFVAPAALAADKIHGDGWIPTFRAAGDHWSFAAVDESGRVTEVREKHRISPHATVGLYWFSSFDLYADAYGRHYEDPKNVERGERYVAPIYNRLISNGNPVFIHDIAQEAVIPLGVPDEVEAFKAARAPRLLPRS